MKIYNYDPKTKELISETFADIDPLESELKNETVFLIPANATKIEPPEIEENEKQIFENNEWKIVPDYRNKTYWNKTTKRPFFINELNVNPSSLNLTEKEPKNISNWNGEDWVDDLEIWMNIYVRPKRNQLLKATDILYRSDIERKLTNNDKYLRDDYSQKLRNLTKNITEIPYPLDDIKWPEKPEFINVTY